MGKLNLTLLLPLLLIIIIIMLSFLFFIFPLEEIRRAIQIGACKL